MYKLKKLIYHPLRRNTIRSNKVTMIVSVKKDIFIPLTRLLYTPESKSFKLVLAGLLT